MKGNTLRALALTFLLVLLQVSCSGGGAVEVTPEVDIEVNPTPSMTAGERLNEMGISGVDALYEEYADGVYLRVEWLDPNPVIADGGKVDFGAIQVFAKPWMISEGEFVETPITSYEEVEFSATYGNPTALDTLLWQLFWHEIAGPTDVTGTVKVLPEEFVKIWDQLNGDPLATFVGDYADVSVSITDGLVSIDDGGIELWLGAIGAGLLVAATGGTATPVCCPGWCPQLSKPWTVSPTNSLPTVALTAAPMNGMAPLMVHCTAVATDADGTIMGYEWDVDDGEGFAPGVANYNITFPESGTYTVTVRVTDDDGATATDAVEIVVTQNEPPVNEAPTAALTVSPTTGVESVEVTLDASGSTDSDGTIDQYEWDFDGDGTYDKTTTASTTSHTYGVGTHTAKVRVTDDDGATGTAAASEAVVVSESTGPTWGDDPYDRDLLLISVTPNGVDAGEVISLSASGDEAQWVLVDIFYDGTHRESGIDGKYFTFSFSSTTPGLVTASGYIDAAGMAAGTYNVGLAVTIQTAPTPDVIGIDIPVTIVN
ncbi:MAG: PKD domain-containing protein [Patescibacteria group bacterium]|nr:PKD domain-containing protein [Patescibacteria group bacterium]